MATRLKVVSGLLVINSKFGVRTDSFEMSGSRDGVNIKSVIDGSNYFVKLKDAEIDGATFETVEDLFEAIAALSSEGGGGSSGPTDVTSDQISDATDVGKQVLTAANAAGARSAIGAGTSNLQIGTTASTAMAGNTNIPAAPTWGNISGKPAVVAEGADAAAARTSIGAGTSNLAIGTTASTAAAGNHTHGAATTSAPGFMSAADKTKLNGISDGATNYNDDNVISALQAIDGYAEGAVLTVTAEGPIWQAP